MLIGVNLDTDTVVKVDTVAHFLPRVPLVLIAWRGPPIARLKAMTDAD
jgi:hypothetical protein